MLLLRSSIFNICFFCVNVLMCLACIPGLLLPKKQLLKLIRFYLHIIYALERIILNLDYEVRGIEHLPKTGSYLVACKHYSSYETFKLHFLFEDPVIILKKELLYIPIWGWFLASTDPIAINRKARRKASLQVIEGAKRMMDQNRPIVIFPQGTRVANTATTDEKPYKIGVVRMQAETGMPIIPLALNTGRYAPRKSWIKYPGKVIFEFLPPIESSNVPPEQVIKNLEKIIEHNSVRLMKE